MLLELLLLLAAIAAPVAYAASDDKSDSDENKSHESIRLYPSERKAVRYIDGEREEYDY